MPPTRYRNKKNQRVRIQNKRTRCEKCCDQGGDGDLACARFDEIIRQGSWPKQALVEFGSLYPKPPGPFGGGPTECGCYTNAMAFNVPSAGSAFWELFIPDFATFDLCPHLVPPCPGWVRVVVYCSQGYFGTTRWHGRVTCEAIIIVKDGGPEQFRPTLAQGLWGPTIARHREFGDPFGTWTLEVASSNDPFQFRTGCIGKAGYSSATIVTF